MSSVTLSPKFQIVIPKEARETLGLKPGQKLQVFALAGRIEVVPVRPLKSMRGFAKGIKTDVPRETDRT